MKRTFFLLLVFLFLSSCASVSDIIKTSPEPQVSDEELPKTVAVLPFENKTDEKGIASQTRKAFYNHFSSKPYRDIELNIVDEKIIHLEKSTGKNILEIPPKDICQAIGCDGLIYGKVTDYKKIYAVAYSQLGIEAEISMINTKTEKEVFKIKDSVRYHEGSVPLSPLSAIMTAVSTAMNLREIQQIRMVNELSYKFNEKIPSPSGTLEERPLIKEVLSNIKESPFGKGKVIKVGVEGDKGLVATFDIGSFKKGILMKETQPGIYIGEYFVLPGDNVKEAPIVVSLKKPGGYETQWIDVSGFVLIDTTPPPKVAGLKAKGFYDRIEVTWDSLKDIPDLKGYKILRSDQPLTGFKEIGNVELTLYEDKAVEHGKIYYYRIIAYDITGNESEVQDAVKASLATKEPKIITGIAEKDLILSGTYIIKDSFTIPKGITLTIEPDTRLMFAENASLVIQGRLNFNAKGSPVEFISIDNKKWKGVLIENSYAKMNGFLIKNAIDGITFLSSDGIIENGIITLCNRGISISSTPSPLIQNITISENKTGIELFKSGSKIVSSNIFQNETGAKLNGFSGEIRECNIYDNNVNVYSEAATRLDRNYFGSINIDEMRLKNIQLSKVYDGKIPDGKIVDAISNPYSNLSEEERTKKATEFVIEAGGFFRQRNYGKAVRLFEEAIKAKPSPEVYYYLTLSYQEMKEDDTALKYLKEGVEKFPKDSTLKRSLGLIYYQMGKQEEAKKAFEDVLRLNPEDRQVKFLIERIAK